MIKALFACALLLLAVSNALLWGNVRTLYENDFTAVKNMKRIVQFMKGGR